MIPFLSFNEVSKAKFVNILSIKETAFDATLVGLVIKCNHVPKFDCKSFEFLNFRFSLHSLRLKSPTTKQSFFSVFAFLKTSMRISSVR